MRALIEDLLGRQGIAPVRVEFDGPPHGEALSLRTDRYKQAHLKWQLGLALADLASAAIAIEVAVLAGGGDVGHAQAWRGFVAPGAILTALWLLLALRQPGYLPRPRRPLITTANQCFVTVALGALACVALLYVVAPASLPSRMMVLPASASMFVLMLVVRAVAARLAPSEPFVDRYLILGDGSRASVIIDELRNGAGAYRDIIGVIPVATNPACIGDVPVVGTVATAPQVVTSQAVTHLVVCQPQPLSRSVARSVADCEAAGALVATMERTYEALTRRTPIFHVEDQWIAELGSATETFYPSRVKRLLDLVLASAGLVVTAPLLCVLAVVIRLTSKGPAFYLQERVGQDGRPFIFTKLRTMVQDAEAVTGPVWAAADDPRVTPVGRLLRKMRLDELPQLWSVLRGDMSLVGPRPERRFFVERFIEEIPLYGKRLLVRPGITGWAQVHHRYDTCEDDVIEKLRYDLFYVGRVSFKLDLLILLKTIGVVLGRRGAH